MANHPSAKPGEEARRVAKLQSELKRRRLDAMVVYDRFNSFYLTGLRCSLSYLLLTPRSCVLLVDGRYIEAARDRVTHCEVRLMSTLAASLDAWQKETRPARIGFEGSTPWSLVRDWGQMLPGTEWEEAGELLRQMRLIKSAAEANLIALSARLNDEVYELALASAIPGATELDLRNVIRAEADRRGADGLSFETIAATGAMSSRPHYSPAANPLKSGDLLLIDMGMLLGGYCSDMTRVVGLGKKPPAKLAKVYEAVLEAQEAALDAVSPGVACAELDRIAREKLKARRLAQYFTHGLGHGVGLEIHEAPVLNARSQDVLRPGMVVTIEPGVYLPGLGGVRIEDLVLVTKTGHKVLSRSPKEFRLLPFAS